MKSLKLSLLATVLILPLITQASIPVNVEANTLQGQFFNKEVLGAKFKYAKGSNAGLPYFLSEDGRLFGTSSYEIDQGTPFNTNLVYSPTLVYEKHKYISLLNDEVIKDLEITDNARFILTESGRVFAAGFNSQGVLGNGTTLGQPNSPFQETTEFFPDLGEDSLLKFTGNFSSTYVLTEQKQVLAYGSSLPGPVGTSYVPINITELFTGYDRTLDPIVQILPGLALTESGIVYRWADPFNTSATPTIFFDGSILEVGEKVIQITGGPTSMSFLTNEGRMIVWGRNDSLQLGIDNSGANVTTFTFVDLSQFSFLSPTNKLVYLSNDFAFSENGEVIAWGSNASGITGNNTNFTGGILMTDVTSNVRANLQEGEYFVFASKSPRASFLISNFGFAYGLGDRTDIGMQLDGVNLPIRTPVAVNPERLTIVVDPLGGPEYGPFYWPKGYPINFSSLLSLSTPNLYVRPGYTFLGFYYDAAFTQPVETFGDYSNELVPLTIYPRWNENTFTVNYVSTAGPMTHSNPTSITSSQLPYTLLPATAPGYTFVGWFTNTNLSDTTSQVTEITLENYVSTLYARFTAGSSSSETSSLPPTSQPTSGDGETPTGPNRIGTILLTTTVVALAGGGFYWFVIAKKSFPALITLFVATFATIKLFFIGLFKKNKKDKTDKK